METHFKRANQFETAKTVTMKLFNWLKTHLADIYIHIVNGDGQRSICTDSQSLYELKVKKKNVSLNKSTECGIWRMKRISTCQLIIYLLDVRKQAYQTLLSCRSWCKVKINVVYKIAWIIVCDADTQTHSKIICTHSIT